MGRPRLSLHQYFSTVILPPAPRWGVFGNVQRHFWKSLLGREGLLVSGEQRPRVLLNVLPHTGQPLTTKNDLAQNVNSGEVKKP